MTTFHVQPDGRVLVRPDQSMTIATWLDTFKISKAAQKNIVLPSSIHLNRPFSVTLKRFDSPVWHEQEARIVYEDDTCLVAYKPAGSLVHDDGSGACTLEDGVNAYLARQGFPFRAKACHRLDVETCGLVLFCKIPFLQSFYDAQFRDQTIQKEYYLITQGRPKQNQQIVELAIARDRHDARKMIARPGGKEATTIFQTLRADGGFALLKARIVHGRKHQIRLHAAQSGFPIVNDPLYNPNKKHGVLLLQCFHLGFVSAQNKQKTDIEVGLDPSLARFAQVHMQGVPHLGQDVLDLENGF
nr:RluA family pseudouridine synthase [uncultured Dubosiella sp.]